MTKIVRGGQSGSLDHIDSSQAAFRSQIAALTDAVRQLGGSAEVGPGTVINDPLNAPYVLYVNPATGDDTFAGGEYSTGGTADERIALQRLECGYTEARPFRTINRAVIEAGIITAKSYYTSPLANNDLVSIVLMPGVYTIHNDAGTTAVSEWPISKSPTIAELVEFNPHSGGGLLLPRGVSLCGLDLRKTIFRPSYVPAVADEAADASNRHAIFKVTGTGYYFGFTFMDKVGTAASHHLLHAFEFAGKAELDEFYGKIRLAFAGASNTGGLDPALAVTQTSEYEIVAPQPAAGSQTVGTDTTLSASPYIFNCSIRSNYGLCGVYADGAKTSGFRSMVIAQFTGVSLQRDLSCWQKYVKGATNKWSTSNFADYDDYISSSPNDVRMDPDRRSFHIRAANDAVVQEVSVFAIGQGVHHWCQSGGEITLTNSNSNFGSVAGLAEGFKAKASPIDGPWNIAYLARPLDPFVKTNNIKRIYLGTLVSGQGNADTTLTLQTALTASRNGINQPELLVQDGYSLRAGDYIWVENPAGDDYRAQLATNPWSSTAPTQIKLAAAMTSDNLSSNRVPGSVANIFLPLAGQRVYVRRFRDVRSTDERRYTIITGSGGSERLPVRDYVLQPTAGPAWTDRLVTVGASEYSRVVTGGCNIELRFAQRPAAETSYSTSVFYRKGDVVRLDGKHWAAVRDNYGTFNAADWQENYVHMEESYAPAAYFRNTVTILAFDKDADESSTSLTLGNSLSDAPVQAQLRANGDYQGLYQLLRNLGRTDAQAITDLALQSEANRNLDVSGNGWSIELRRPSNIRMFGHAWEWAGFLNYTKAIPNYQGTLSPANKFTYYFTNKGGGIVYATGFNEEGLQVSPRGLEDITTGEVLALEDISNADRTIDFPTYYPKLEVDNLVINEGIEGMPEATTTKTGGGQLARIYDLNAAVYPANDAAIDATGAKLLNPSAMIYLGDQRYSPRLTQTARRLYVLPAGETLPAGADAYPLLDGGTVNLNGVKTYGTLAEAYGSLPEQFVLPEGASVDIYLLSDIVNLGGFSGTPCVGSGDSDKLTRVIPLNWNQSTSRQIIKYSIPTSHGNKGPFRNVVFVGNNASSQPMFEGRTKLEVALSPHPAGLDPTLTTVVGRNIKSTNLWVEITLAADDGARRVLTVFEGFVAGPNTTWQRNNENPSYLKVSLEGAGKQITLSDTNDLFGYDLVVFKASKDHPVQYGACMTNTSASAGYTDEQLRRSTALYEFVNNRSATVKVLFNHIAGNSEYLVDGASYAGWTHNITWRLSGTSPWSWRLFGFYKAFYGLSGENASRTDMLLTARGLTSQTWGGFINSNGSTCVYKAVHTPGPFTNCVCEGGSWGIFGAHNSVAAADSLLGADGTGYFLRPDASRYNIVIPAK